MFNVYELTSFALYLALVTWVGFYFFSKKLNIEEYVLGGKSMGKWVTAISAQASDMSGWLLMGLPGAIYLSGLSEAWIAIGLGLGTILNWKFIAPRLRTYTGKTDSLTLPHFFEKRFGDPTGLLRILSAIITLFFFTIYAASGLNATAKLFETMFEVPFGWALCVGGLCIIIYTFLGGYLAVCWTDLIQGILMVIAIVAVPLMAYVKSGGMAGIEAAAAAKNISLSLWPQGERPLLGIISTAAWGLGYCGMPHILARFMSVRKVKDLRPAMWIAVVWVVISLGFAVFVGMVGMAAIPGLVKPDHEKVFILMARNMFHPLLSGIFLAAILAAIMSTIDSQLLVSASVLTEDLNRKIGRRKLSEKTRLTLGRIGVAVIAVIAMVIAADRDSSILKLVEYAWGGLGAAFGPVVIMSLYSRRTSWQSALLGMCLGSVALVAWERVGMSAYMYEIVPGFLVNLFAIIIGNKIWPETNEHILREYDEHTREVHEDEEPKKVNRPSVRKQGKKK